MTGEVIMYEWYCSTCNEVVARSLVRPPAGVGICTGQRGAVHTPALTVHREVTMKDVGRSMTGGRIMWGPLP